MSVPKDNNKNLHLWNDDGSEVTPRVLSAAVVSDAGNVAYTAAQALGGLILRDPNGGARTDTLPSAADIIAALGGADVVPVGMSAQLHIRNTADAAETLSVAAGTGVTLAGDGDIAQNNGKDFLIVVMSSSAVTVYAKGSVDFTA